MAGRNGGERTIGVHGLAILEAVYLLGCATSRDLAGILDLEIGVTGKQLQTLSESGYLNHLRGLPSWQKSTGGSLPYIYLLTRRGVAVGAGAAGIEDEKLARTAYASCRPESLYSHRLMQTRYVRYLMEATRSGIFNVEYYGAEHSEGFPLELVQGSGYLISRILPARQLQRIIRPDGLLQLGVRSASSDEPPLNIFLELETGSRNLKDVLAKVLTYMAYLELLCYAGESLPLPDDPGGMRYFHCPGEAWPAVLFLTPIKAAARRMRDYVMRGLEKHAGYQRWVGRIYRQHEIDPGWMFLFGSLEACASGSSAPPEEIYLPLAPHEDSREGLRGSREYPDHVSLLDVLAISSGWAPVSPKS